VRHQRRSGSDGWTLIGPSRLSRLTSDGRIQRCYPGLGPHPVALTGADAGAIVMSVDPKGPVAAASVDQGDVIVALSGEPIRHVESLLHWGQIACGIWSTEGTEVARAAAYFWHPPAHNRLVAGSSPAGPTMSACLALFLLRFFPSFTLGPHRV